MSVDVRFRVDTRHHTPVDPAAFFDHELPAALARSAASMRDALAWLDLEPLTIAIADDSWHLEVSDHAVRVATGPASSGATVRLSGEQFDDLVTDRATFMGFFTHGALDQSSGRLEDLLDWWLVLRAALDDLTIHTPHPLDFRDLDGSPLDLRRSFTIHDDPRAMQQFLEQAGYLHLQGVFTVDEMQQVDHDMDNYADAYAPDDGVSWWATTADGAQRLVRMQSFQLHSAATAALLDDERMQRIGTIPGDQHRARGWAQALVKPIGVVEGISDVPWHKDCSLGRHSYDCCSMTVGISVTGADARSGQLRVIAGSHRVLVWPTFVGKETRLPEVDLPTRTGDVTVHLSCTKHMSQPPVARERRVLYTGFDLPPADPDLLAEERARLYRIMRSIPDGVSQRPSSVTR
jgi:hypothetical protein